MISTIRTWIYRIQNYEEQMHKLENSDRTKKKFMGEIATLKKERKESQNEMKRLVSLLSGNTWKE